MFLSSVEVAWGQKDIEIYKSFFPLISIQRLDGPIRDDFFSSKSNLEFGQAKPQKAVGSGSLLRKKNESRLVFSKMGGCRTGLKD